MSAPQWLLHYLSQQLISDSIIWWVALGSNCFRQMKNKISRKRKCKNLLLTVCGSSRTCLHMFHGWCTCAQCTRFAFFWPAVSIGCHAYILNVFVPPAEGIKGRATPSASQFFHQYRIQVLSDPVVVGTEGRSWNIYGQHISKNHSYCKVNNHFFFLKCLSRYILLLETPKQ